MICRRHQKRLEAAWHFVPTRDGRDTRRNSPAVAGNRPAAYYLVYCLLAIPLVTGCSDASDGPHPALGAGAPAPGGSPAQAREDRGHGHFRGTATIGERLHHAEAIISIDGAFRLYVGGPGSAAGPSGNSLNPTASTQVFGSLALENGRGTGGALVVGQYCPADDAARFCGNRLEAVVSIEDTDGWLTGEVRVRLDEGEEIWVMDMAEWSIYYDICRACSIAGGLFEEVLAPFSEVIINVSDSLFFQDPVSGCVGNGSFTQRGDYYLFDVSLAIANCNIEYQYLNSDMYVGLATATQGAYWDYDEWLLIIAAAMDSERPSAVTMYAGRL